ncbi:hypothetical protein HMPREF9419_2399, partial [Prevotella nigrescens ATCC 33563]
TNNSLYVIFVSSFAALAKIFLVELLGRALLGLRNSAKRNVK